MPKVLISDALSNLANDVFKSHNIEVDTITDLKPFELQEIIHKYDGLVVRSATKATDEIISSKLESPGSKFKFAILSIGARFVTLGKAAEIIDMWLVEAFKGGRHEKRINKRRRL